MSSTRRRILLCVSGMSPQIVTETVYALGVGNGPESAVPHEVHLVTTTEGAERARLWLLSERPGWFKRLCEEHRFPAIRFDESTIHVLREADGTPLADVRTALDNTKAADSISELIRSLTVDPGTELHVSLAGGRKTLGFFAGYALSLWGRDHDRLSHVLVNPPFESSPEFFYPSTDERIIEVGREGHRRPVDCRHARVTLADLPFVRLRHGLPTHLLSGSVSYAEAVAAAQSTFAPPHVRIEVDLKSIEAGGQRVRMAPTELAFYLWFARRAKGGLSPIERPATDNPRQDYAREYLAAYDVVRGLTKGIARRLSAGMSKEDFDVFKSKTNSRLRAALGPVSRHYAVAGEGEGIQRYAIRLPPSAIEIGGLT